MASNNFRPFATEGNANVTSQADYEALQARRTGFQSGKASSAQVNKALRQATFIAAALAQYTSDKSGQDVLDDGNIAGFMAKMTSAFGKDFQSLDATLSALASLNGDADKLPYFSGPDAFSLTDFTPVGRDILAKGSVQDILAYLGLVPAVVLPRGYNIPAHILNTPGIVYSGQFPGTYTNEPAFGGEWFDVYSAKHVSDACTFIAVSRTGKIATASYSANTFSGWNYGLNSSNTTQAGRDFVAKNDATEMAKYLGLDVISGRLLNIVKMTASGTYTPSAGTKSIIVEAIGGGGASGNITATAASQNAVSAAGSNGGYAKARYTSGFSSVAVSIGTGGIVNGNGGGNGGNGGATTFGSLMTCPGGNGSTVGIANAPPFNAGAAQPSGSPSGSGIIFSNKGPYSPWPTVVALGMGSNFANCIVPELGSYGMGGDGVVSDASSAAKSGNAGTSGCVVIWEYA